MSDDLNDNWDDVDEVEDDWEDPVEEMTQGDEAAEPPIEIDPEDPIAFPEQYYTVQLAYEQEGKEVLPETEVVVKCTNCAAWNAPLSARNGKPLCRPGRTAFVEVGDETHEWRMSEERYSCQKHFIPKDMEGFLQHMVDDLDYVKMLRWSWPAIVKLVKLQDRIRKFCARTGRDSEKVINDVMDFAMLFSSEQQIGYTKPFLKAIIDGLNETKPKRQPRKKSAFHPGDEVSWESRPGGPRVEGFIRKIGRGRNANIIIIVAGDHVRTLKPNATENAIQWERPLAEWKKLDPKKVAATPVVSVDRDG